MRARYTAMLMSDVRRECLKKGVSQLGTKDKMIERLVEKEKPPGGCAHSRTTQPEPTGQFPACD